MVDAAAAGAASADPILVSLAYILTIKQRLIEELKSESSRVLFLLSTASDPSVPGSSVTGPGREDAAPQDGGPPQARVGMD